MPVNLRGLFPSQSLRNFAQYVTPEADSRLGDYTLEELCRIVHHRMGLEVTRKNMSARIATNVNSERIPILKVMPLFIKNFAMKMVYNRVGERKSSICMSNLGLVTLPEPLSDYVTRIDFVLGVQADTPCNCGICSYGGKLYINVIRSIREPELERRFFTFLRRAGLHVLVESNQRDCLLYTSPSPRD